MFKSEQNANSFAEKKSKSVSSNSNIEKSNVNNLSLSIHTKRCYLYELKDDILAIYSKKFPIAIPTETVYGLSVPYYDSKMINMLYKIKNRPINNPLILHVAHKEDINQFLKWKICWCANCLNIENVFQHLNTKVNCSNDEVISKKNKSKFLIDKNSIFSDCEYFKTEYPIDQVIANLINRRLIEKFWPGPLSLLFKSNQMHIQYEYIVIRSPANIIAHDYINRIGPIFAPSANLSGRVSTTNADHVMDDLGGKIEIIIMDDSNTDFYSCSKKECIYSSTKDKPLNRYGIESTIFNTYDLSVLRAGSITKDDIFSSFTDIANFVQKYSVSVKYATKFQIAKKINQLSKSDIIVPGTLFKHYVPTVPFILFENIETLILQINQCEQKEIICVLIINTNVKIHLNKLFHLIEYQNYRVDKSILESTNNMINEQRKILFYNLGKNYIEHQQNLFLALRELEKNVDKIFLIWENNENEGFWDRVKRASGYIDQ